MVRVAPAGFRYGLVHDIFRREIYAELARGYPDIAGFKPVHVADDFKNPSTKVLNGPRYGSREDRGCADALAVGNLWRAVLIEAASAEYIRKLVTATGVTFNSLREFAFNYGKEGCEIKPHLDGSARTKDPARTRLVTICYLAERLGGGPGGTVIYDRDRTTVLVEASDLHNAMLFFEQHHDAWHGYPTIPAGAERKTLLMSFNLARRPVRIKTGWLHRLLCRRHAAVRA